ncbi:hypothetical protein DGWBC_1305 [Dehalogenimonas sp. WBC-2]|nr:hypothetical protein DGWBC_1305 [Dehalogenimonas sp. WBC-2]
MKIGPGELLLVVAVILILVGASRMKKVSQDVKKQNDAARPVRRAGSAPVKPSIKYPQLQLLGVLVLLAGGAMVGIGYLLSQPGITLLSIAGIAVFALGIAFIILARRR